MYYHLMASTDIRQNLATEEYLLNHLAFDEPLLLFYIQEPALIIGKHQHLSDEVNLAYVKEQGITLTRRISGGGAVYIDLGNLSFSFVSQVAGKYFGDFRFFTEPVLAALASLGVTDAELSGRNDLLIAGKKFSGNAMYQRGDKLFSHGTLMLDVDLAVLPLALHVSPEKLKGKGVASVRSRVTNLRPYLSHEFQALTTAGFRDQLLLKLFAVDHLSQIKDKEYRLTASDQQAIEQLVTDRYGNHEWVYGSTAEYSLKRSKRFKSGSIEVRLLLVENHIAELRFTGDYFSQKDSAELAQQLNGLPYQRTVLEKQLATLPISDYFSKITAAELLDVLIEQHEEEESG